MIRESFFDRQRQLRRMTVWLLMLTVIGAIGNALTGGFVSLLAYQYDSTGPQSFSATMSMGQAFAMGATLMVVLVALITLGQYVALRILSGGARRFFAARDLCTDNEVARLELAERQLVNVVQEMAIAASVRPPHVYLTEDPAINSFALITAGAQPVVGVSRGSLKALSRDELQAMVAHEIAHLANGDARINLGLLSLVRGFSSIYDFSAGVIRAPMPRRCNSCATSKR